MALPVILVHGVPDTDHVWHRLIPQLGRRDVVSLRLPRFGTTPPAGFDPTHDAYARRVAGWLAAQPMPVDVVGHDWGALLVLRAACLVPDRVRTWAVGAAPLDTEYVWHQAALMWQTPDVGEQLMAKMTPAAMEKALATAQVAVDDARVAASHVDDTMKRCILRLYRSGKNVGADWGPELARLPKRGLILWGEHDPYAPPTWGERLARRTGGRLVTFPGCSHGGRSSGPPRSRASCTRTGDEACRACRPPEGVPRVREGARRDAGVWEFRQYRNMGFRGSQRFLMMLRCGKQRRMRPSTSYAVIACAVGKTATAHSRFRKQALSSRPRLVCSRSP